MNLADMLARCLGIDVYEPSGKQSMSGVGFEAVPLNTNPFSKPDFFNLM